jgi:hypothetical protein
MKFTYFIVCPARERLSDAAQDLVATERSRASGVEFVKRKDMANGVASEVPDKTRSPTRFRLACCPQPDRTPWR